MKLEKYLNDEEDRLIKSIDVNINFLYGLNSKSFKTVENFIKKQLMKKMKGIKITIDSKYE